VLGICNGFQVLTEMGLLPGALVRNAGLRFRCETVTLKVENAETPFTRGYDPGALLSLPIAHGEGSYVAPPDVLDKLEREGRVVFRYVDSAGEPAPEANPNGSARNIAGIVNERGNVVGMMPHPERAAERLLGSEDGRKIFESMLAEAAR
jgi:phosphoribosylformylglycinamidine synthase I